MTLTTLAEWKFHHGWYRQLTSTAGSSAAMPTTDDLPRMALRMPRDIPAASRGCAADVHRLAAAGVLAARVMAAAAAAPAPGTRGDADRQHGRDGQNTSRALAPSQPHGHKGSS